MHWDGTDKCVLAAAQDNPDATFSKKASLSAKGRTQDGMLADFIDLRVTDDCHCNSTPPC